ncbi:MAG: TRAP transporter small permease subunit [bacterium]|jgi:TRAP-type mannitol/chloroaromatic compound transport system permease small subunit|nr:TRAP transporter small permease subunit [bacterium]
MNAIDTLNEYVGKAVSWLTTILVLVICFDVIMRYLFTWSSAAVFELEWHIFASIFMVGSAYALKHDKHVRVDLFYSKFSEKKKAWVNLIGTLIFLFPFCIVIIWTSIPFVQNSFRILETSPDPGGLPARFIIKSTIPIGFILLLLQGVSIVTNSLKTIVNPKPADS